MHNKFAYSSLIKIIERIRFLKIRAKKRLLIKGMLWASMCMFDKSHLTFKFKSKVSRDVFKNENECQSTSIFSSKMSPQFSWLVVHVISFFEVSIGVWFFPSQVILHVKI